MNDEDKKLYEFAPLDSYDPKRRFLIRLADLAFYLAIRILGPLTRFEVRGRENFDAIVNAGKVPIYAFWHQRIFLSTYYFRGRGIVVMTSQSFDGEYIARFIQRLGYGAVRGSSSRGGARALIEAVRSMRRGRPIGFTMDGPRGPQHIAKPGAVLLAGKTGNPIMPFVVEPKSRWTLKSWDRMHVPKPFTRALVLIGESIYVESDAAMDEKLKELQGALDRLEAQALKWSGREPDQAV